MSSAAKTNPTVEKQRGEITVRPEEARDQEFLFELYASTRQEELDAWGWPAEMRVPFLHMQFQASQGYHLTFPGADFQLVLLDGVRAGRLIVNRGAAEIRLVDISLLPGNRNAGIGSILVQRILAEAAAAGKPVRLSVLKSNRAQRLYQRLGFVNVGETEMHLELEWR